MKHRPAFVQTPVGELGATITAPDEAATVGVLLLQGRGQRSGPQGVWTTLAGELARRHALVLRVDYPGFGDSSVLARDDARTPWVSSCIAEVAGRVSAPVAVVGSCYGGRLAISAASMERDVAGLALLTPAMRATSIRDPWQRAVHHVKRMRGIQPLQPDLTDALTGIARRMPVALIYGAQDAAAGEGAAVLRWADRRLPEAQRHVFPDGQMHGPKSAAIQAQLLATLSMWLETVKASA